MSVDDGWSKRDFTDEEFEALKSGEMLVKQCMRGWKLITEEELLADFVWWGSNLMAHPDRYGGGQGLDDFTFMWVVRRLDELTGLRGQCGDKETG